VAPDPSENGTVYPIRIALDVDNQNYKYKIGMTGDSTFILSKKSDALFVPSDAVRNDREGSYVLINGGKEKRYIETGIEGGDKVEIVNGISEGEKVYY
jgi:macrolide-specific efflux system membrane fusion protein